MEFVAVGRLMRAHGIHGDILCMPLSHSVERHSLLKRVFIETAGGTKEAVISNSEEYNGVWKLHFEGLNSPEAVKPFVNAHILVPESERLPLPEGQYYFSDFENFKAIDKDGNEIGEVLTKSHGERLSPCPSSEREPDCISSTDRPDSSP